MTVISLTDRLPLYQISPMAVTAPLGEGVALFDKSTGAYFTLNRSAARVWREAGHAAARDDLLIALLGGRGSVPPSAEAEADLDALLRDLVAAGLFVVSGGDASPADRAATGG